MKIKQKKKTKKRLKDYPSTLKFSVFLYILDVGLIWLDICTK